MKILVTGGAGNVGRGVVARLLNSGHQVKVVDWKIQDQQAGADYAECDITNYPALREQVRGLDAIIHLAAYPYPGAASGPEIFRVNCTGTYNIFEAAAAEGIRRVACASSINALGYNFGVKAFPIQQFPIDETHPTFTTDPYSFSKQTTEAIAAYYWRRDGISSTLLRMPFIYTTDGPYAAMAKQFVGQCLSALQELLAQPEDQRRARVAKMLANLADERAGRVNEKPWQPGGEGSEDAWPTPDPDQLAFFGYSDFWSILSVEDTALAFEQSLLADFEGSHPLYVSEKENCPGVNSELLLETFYPEVKARLRPIPGASTLVSYDCARRLIGFEPQYTFRERIS